MAPENKRALNILRKLGSYPTVPFYEQKLVRYIQKEAWKLGLSARCDSFGNIIVHYKNISRRNSLPLAYVSHMDHPGFELILSSRNRLLAHALGGVPLASLCKRTAVLVVTPDGQRIPAQIHPLKNKKKSLQRKSFVSVHLSSQKKIIPPLPIVFDLPDFSQKGNLIHMRAADDLAGCAMILSVLDRLVKMKAKTELYAVFTRAEENGLLGARLMAEAKSLPSKTIIVSVECSSLLPGVSQGEGPIIRTGDRASTFDRSAEQILIAATNRIRKRDPHFKYQRHLMAAGVCEATAFAAYGYLVTGLALPLGHWHNATTNINDPHGGVKAESITLSDYINGIKLLTEATQHITLFPKIKIRPVDKVLRKRLISSR